MLLNARKASTIHANAQSNMLTLRTPTIAKEFLCTQKSAPTGEARHACAEVATNKQKARTTACA